MHFNSHLELQDKHAFLSPSSYHWIRYDLDKLKLRYSNHREAMRGTELHEFAAQCIRLKIRLQASKKTLNQYVNDAIGYRMKPEQVLYYSDVCFGTADAISFNKNLLRIHDLKNGVSPTSMDQLEIYAALFCLEYRVKPGDIQMELRIYKNDEVLVHIPEVDNIAHIMDTIISFSQQIEKMRAEGEW